MIKHAALVTVVATAGLLYTALTRETDLAEFDRKELEALIESPRPALTPNPLVEDHRQQFARLMMDYAEQENERLQREIDDANWAFRAKVQRKVEAAVRIQRAWKRYRRFKIVGVSTDGLDQVGTADIARFLGGGEIPRKESDSKSPSQRISSQRIKRIPLDHINFKAASYN